VKVAVECKKLQNQHESKGNVYDWFIVARQGLGEVDFGGFNDHLKVLI
jgi:hypothetical protein